jgi:hypothetical protein
VGIVRTVDLVAASEAHQAVAGAVVLDQSVVPRVEDPKADHDPSADPKVAQIVLPQVADAEGRAAKDVRELRRAVQSAHLVRERQLCKLAVARSQSERTELKVPRGRMFSLVMVLTVDGRVPQVQTRHVVRADVRSLVLRDPMQMAVMGPMQKVA